MEGIRWDKDEVFPALSLLEGLQIPILDYVTEILNSYHGAEHQASYYDLICGEWILTFSHVLYASYLHVQRGLPLERWSGAIPVFPDYRGFLDCVVADSSFTKQLAAHTAAVLAGEDDAFAGFAADSIRVGGGEGISLRSRIGGWGRKASGALAQKNARFYFCRPHLNRCSRLEWASTLFNWRKWAREENFDYPIDSISSVDSGWRSRTSRTAQGSTFADLVRRMLPLYLPSAYLEAFSSLRNQAHALKIPRPGAIYTANSLHGHTLFKFLAADWQLEKTKVLNHQHGGNYGLDRIHSVENYETRAADHFYTLGWSGGSPKQTSLPGAVSAKWTRAGSEKGKILLNCIAYPPTLFRIHFQPMPGTFGALLGETSDFVSRTREIPEITLRPSPNDFGMRTAETLRSIRGDIRLDDMKMKGIQSYAASELVVHNYLGTSWLETLALNIPTVCFYDPQTYAFRDSAIGPLQRLKDAGILHESGRDAARFVLSVAKNIRAWWEKAEVQEARTGFAGKYALYSPDWPDVWESEFAKWIA